MGTTGYLTLAIGKEKSLYTEDDGSVCDLIGRRHEYEKDLLRDNLFSFRLLPNIRITWNSTFASVLVDPDY